MTDKFDEVFGTTENVDEEANVETTEALTPEQEIVETTEEPTETEQTQNEDVQPDSTDTRAIPPAVIQAERQRRQEAERIAHQAQQQLMLYQQQLQQLQAQVQQAPQAGRPDPFDNPEEYDAYVQNAVAQRVQLELQQRDRHAHLQNFDASFRRAASSPEVGEEAAKEALNWAYQVALQNDAWGQQALSQPDPLAWIVEQKNRHAQYEEFQRDPQGFVAKKAAELGIAGSAQAAPVNHQQMGAALSAPKSLAGGRSAPATRPTAQSEKEIVDSIFNLPR